MQTEDLKALGLNDEQAKSVFALYGKSLNAEKEKSKAELEAKDAQLADLSKQLKDRDKDLKDLKKTADEETQQKIADFQEKHKAELKEANDRAAKATLEGKISEALGTSKARNVNLLRKALNYDDISLNEDGNIIGLNEQISKLQETDAYLFDLGTKPKGTDPKSGTGDNGFGGAGNNSNDFASFAAENRIIK